MNCPAAVIERPAARREGPIALPVKASNLFEPFAA